MTRRLWSLAVVFTLCSSGALAEDGTVTIGTGDQTGVYFPSGSAICRLVNGNRRSHGLRCDVETTGGSADNLDRLRTGETDFGITQSDLLFHAYNGSSAFEEVGEMKDLRTVFALHAEPFTVIAHEDAGIAVLDDLKGKRVNIGSPGSGQRGTLKVVMAAKGWTFEDFAETTEFETGEMAEALCARTVDAIVYAVGHPSAAVQQATAACDSVLVPVTGPEIDALIEDRPYYRSAEIPGGLYRGNAAPVPTFGVGAMLVTTADAPEDMVHAVAQSVFENISRFKGMHPAFAKLDERDMANAGPAVPLHPGAERYFREAGLLD